MANEITLSVSFSAAQTLGAAVAAALTKTSNMVGSKMSSQTTLSMVANAAVPVGNVSIGGMVVIRNLHATEPVFFGRSGISTANAACAVEPLGIAVFKSGAALLYVVSAVDDVRIQVTTIDV